MNKRTKKGLTISLVIIVIVLMISAIIYINLEKNYEKSDSINFILSQSDFSIRRTNNETIDLGEAPGDYKLIIDLDINGSRVDVHLFNHSFLLKSWDNLSEQYIIIYQPSNENPIYARNLYNYSLLIELSWFSPPVFWPYLFTSNVTLNWKLVR